jgi:hypothetical protein
VNSKKGPKSVKALTTKAQNEISFSKLGLNDYFK